MRIAIVGARGFIGSAVREALRKGQHEIVRVVAPRPAQSRDPSANRFTGEPPRAWANEIDRMAGAFADVEVVVNAAGLPAATSNDEGALFAANAVAPVLIGAAAAAAGCRRLVHISSAAVQGAKPTLDEGPAWHPATPYARSKAAGEHALLAPILAVPAEVIVYRPPSVQGADRPLSSVLGRFARARFVPMFGDGDAPLPLADVRNVASAVATLVEADDPPSVVLHPSEGFTVRGLIRVMGGQPMSLPHTSGRLAVGILHVVGRRSSLAGATARRLELLVSGQGQDTTTLPDLGFAPAVSREAMARISRRRIPRILHVAASEYSVATLLLPQLRFLADLGFDVRVGCSPEGGTFRPALRAFRPIALGFPRALKPNRMAVAMCRFLLLVRRDTPDVVHLHSPAAALTVRLFPRWVLPRNTRIIYTVHGFKHTWEEPMSLGDRVLEFLERHQSQRTDALLFQSEEDFEEARRRRYGGQSVLLGNGVEEPWFEVPDPVRSGPLKLLFVGRLVREKGVLDLCAAVQRVTQDVVVAIAGGQPSSERNGVADLVAQAANAPETRGRIALFGHVTGDVLRDLIAEHDAVVLPSYREGLPRSVIEALAAGRPAIVTDIRGCRELVTDGVNGLIVPAGDLPALTAAIDRLAVLDADRFAAMSNAARESAANRHESQVVRRILRVYQTVGVTPPGDDDFDPLPAAQ